MFWDHFSRDCTELRRSVRAKFEAHPFFVMWEETPAGMVSRPTLRRRTPIATTGLRFIVHLDTEGTLNVRLIA